MRAKEDSFPVVEICLGQSRHCSLQSSTLKMEERPSSLKVQPSWQWVGVSERFVRLLQGRASLTGRVIACSSFDGHSSIGPHRYLLDEEGKRSAINGKTTVRQAVPSSTSKTNSPPSLSNRPGFRPSIFKPFCERLTSV